MEGEKDGWVERGGEVRRGSGLGERVYNKDARGRHVHPLTDGNFPISYLDGRQTTRCLCRTIGLTPLTNRWTFPLD